MRFTATAGEPSLPFVGVAEVKVIGSTMIHRTRRPDESRQLLPTSVHTSSTLEVSLPARGGRCPVHHVVAAASAGEFVEIGFQLDVRSRARNEQPRVTSALAVHRVRTDFQFFDAVAGF
jgi:hypothetical protein